MPVGPNPQPNSCTTPPTSTGANTNCDDTYVLALVAYYEVTEPNPIWCQPSGIPCPTRIVRYQIKDGVRDPNSTNPDPSQRYFTGYQPSPAFKPGNLTQPGFDISNPTQNVTKGPTYFPVPEVLVNYIDHSSPGPTPTGNECTTALGNPTNTTTGVTPTPLPEETLKIASATNSFYACVDTARNIARVTIRGNSLRRIQTDANYDAKKAAYFPTASVQVQGLGARGK
jgi:hypothetical protein